MRFAITSQSAERSAEVDPRFGRARYFWVVDTQTGQAQAVDNTPNLQAAQGAGIQSARRCGELGVDVVLTGHVGPKALAVLGEHGIAVYAGVSGTVDHALSQYEQGLLRRTEQATTDSHWAD
jgi:predicted Fe-Mo cluster-binding NifX family protein